MARDDKMPFPKWKAVVKMEMKKIWTPFLPQVHATVGKLRKCYCSPFAPAESSAGEGFEFTLRILRMARSGRADRVR